MKAFSDFAYRITNVTVVCSVRLYVRLSHSCTLLKPLNRMRYHLAGNCLAQSNTVLDRCPSPTREGEIQVSEPPVKIALAAKPLQIAEWLLQTACKNSATPYPTVPSPTPYDLPFPPNNMFRAMPPSALLILTARNATEADAW